MSSSCGANPLQRLAGKANSGYAAPKGSQQEGARIEKQETREGRSWPEDRFSHSSEGAYEPRAGEALLPMVEQPVVSAPPSLDSPWTREFINTQSESSRIMKPHSTPLPLPRTSIFPANSAYSRPTGNQIYSTRRNHDEESFQAAFDSLEKELTEVEKTISGTIPDDEIESINLENEQNGFQEIAGDIVETCHDMDDDKIANSKFLGLMQQISAGDVTLSKEQNSELYSRSLDSRVGNPYYPIQNTLSDI